MAAGVNFNRFQRGQSGKYTNLCFKRSFNARLGKATLLSRHGKTRCTSKLLIILNIPPLYTVLLAHLFLSEILMPGNWVGIILVFLSGILVERSAREVHIDGKHLGRNLVFPLLGGLALGAGSILRKFALDLFNAPVLGVAVAYTFSLVPYLVMFLLSKPTRKEISLKRDLRLFWAAGIDQAVTWMLSFYALSYDTVSVVTPLLSIEPVFVALFAYLYLRKTDKVSIKLGVSIILTVIGVLLVTAKF